MENLYPRPPQNQLRMGKWRVLALRGFILDFVGTSVAVPFYSVQNCSLIE